MYRKLRKLWEHNLFYGASCSRHRNELIAFAKVSRMVVQITVFHNREFDVDNLAGSQKPILDALKNIHFIRDDSAKFLELYPPAQVLSKEGKTVVRISPAI